MAQQLPKVVQNSDLKIEFTLTDADGAAILVSGLTDVEVCIYQRKEVVVQNWKLSDGQIETVNDAGGIIRVAVDRANLTGNNLTRMYGEIAITTADTDFAGNVGRSTISDIPLFDLLNSAIFNHNGN